MRLSMVCPRIGEGGGGGVGNSWDGTDLIFSCLKNVNFPILGSPL